MSASNLKKFAWEDFVVGETVGRGATADVMKATVKSSAAVVCLKVFHSSAFANNRERILREIEVAQKLYHPHIVKVFGIVDRTPPVLVMEYVEGENLASVQQRLPYPLPELGVAILLPVLEALAFAHSQGIVHRDVKPENILLSVNGDVKITDFGLAKFEGMSPVTESVALVGSFDYMSVEQVTGQKVTPSSDLFSISALLYFLVTGTRPFARASIPATLEAIRLTKPEPPHRLNPKVSVELSALILKGLSKASADRFASASDYQQTLVSYLDSVGFTPSQLSVAEWLASPSSTVERWFAQSTSALAEKSEKSFKSGNRVEGLKWLAQLSTRAPYHPLLPQLAAQAAAEKKSGWKKPLLFWLLALVFCVAVVFFLASRNERLPTPAAKEVSAANVIPPPQPETKPAPIKTVTAAVVVKRGSVKLNLPENSEVFWDYKPVEPGATLEQQTAGAHNLLINRLGRDVVRKTIYVQPGKQIEVQLSE